MSETKTGLEPSQNIVASAIRYPYCASAWATKLHDRRQNLAGKDFNSAMNLEGTTLKF